MTTRMTRGLAAVALLMTMAVPAAAADDSDKRDGRPACTTFFTTEEWELVTTGCASPVGFCAEGAFKGNRGFRGTVLFSALSFDPIVSDALGRLVVPGESTYTTANGAFTVSDVSVFDVAAGTFSGIGRITGGTGRFAGATGNVFTAGHALPDGVSFDNETTAEVCVPR